MNDTRKFNRIGIHTLICPPPIITIHNTILTAYNKLAEVSGDVSVLVSGGSDSDIMVHLVNLIPHSCNINYVFFDTGIEYEATKEHLDDMEKEYGIHIHRRKAKVPVPLAVKRYGVPFLAKRQSDYIGRLQSHGFNWEYGITLEDGLRKFGKCETAMKWWTCEYGDKSSFNITKHKLLKEFMSEHPPNFKISNKCCDYAKKKVSHMCDEEFHPALKLLGIRRAESGLRSQAYKNCFSPNYGGIPEYRPLFFWTDEDKAAYQKHYGVKYSRCYTEYGLKRTGCAGCPFGSRYNEEIEVIKKYEPKLYNAVMNIFGEAYDYCNAYREYKSKKG